ncbi:MULTISPECIES: LacI family DNA-binding transcriptional regulator [unclassified Rhizobium]|uniref:LacI family DNA-binding transcriptional regulator n=1 Tax=Rhizobium TaxID=379 RepID=UPI00084BF7CB|nr:MULTISPECIES: LacI family DNA-binding transcriptional regulator [unclassified Rhizobium]MCZ3380191.1 LacI family DNA-binding transcriptional regulator [Rhizobium sp. AG207R]OEC94201.1 LacI family transcriptional regulator [Rhizobium sp. YK2]QYA14767.1 LacI family DNA-binding transcriptional regulator [Rhizobium sp. AB2/73]TWB11454.1 LacI family transcriptional regulator [Rhizobium sp. ERR1071]UEQ83244.1 LacI family DNA-binding transcriptional regulator [Rhizobium sp. AB2/73]
MRRPTISDLAKASGVSVATIDRVLNGRLPVREQTARRVYEAAQEIGYHAVGLLRQRVFEDVPRYQLAFLLQKPTQSFYQAFAKEIEAAAAAMTAAKLQVQIDYPAVSTPSAIAEKMRALAARNQAVAVVAPDYPAVEAIVDELKEKGIPVFSVLSDFAAGVREGYLGLDNRKVGRSAAWTIARTARKPGKVACFVGSHRFHGHELREVGFRSYFRENAPEFEVLETLINFDAVDVTHEATLDLLQKHPDLIGLYVAGGGMEGAIAALREENRAGDVTLIVNELVPESKGALMDGTVAMAICTPLPLLCRELITQMVSSVEGSAQTTARQTFFPFEIYISENI